MTHVYFPVNPTFNPQSSTTSLYSVDQILPRGTVSRVVSTYTVPALTEPRSAAATLCQSTCDTATATTVSPTPEPPTGLLPSANHTRAATTSSPCSSPCVEPTAQCLLGQSASGNTAIINGPCDTPRRPAIAASDLWDKGELSIDNRARVVTAHKQTASSTQKKTNLEVADSLSSRIEPSLPFNSSDDMEGFTVPAKPILKPSLLNTCRFTLPSGKCFLDKVLPRPTVKMVEHSRFNAAYFIDLHNRVATAGQRGQYSWQHGTPNYLGARIPLEHTTFNLPYWREQLIGYGNVEVLQFLEYGFPLGIETSPSLSPSLANHGSAYQFYPWLDKFFAGGLIIGGVTGPCGSAPFSNPMVSPLMTAPKKPGDRRAVFDASYSLQSLNNSTPSDNYLGEKCHYTYPKIEHFQRLILICGHGCLLFKRDLARYFLQLPLDPTEFCYTGVIWRYLFFLLHSADVWSEAFRLAGTEGV